MTPQLPPLDLVKIAEQAGLHVDEGWLTCFEPPHTHPVPEMPSLRKFAELVGLQCAEAAVERYAAQVRAAVKALMEEERALRAKYPEDSYQRAEHNYAALICLDLNERLLKIK